MNRFVSLLVIGLLLFGCIQNYSNTDYALSYHYPSEEFVRINDSAVYQDLLTYDVMAILPEIKNDTLIFHLTAPFLDKPFGRFPTLDYFLRKFPKMPKVTVKNKNTYIITYKNSIVEVISEKVFREYFLILAKNAVITDTCDIFMNKLQIGMSKQQCIDLFKMNSQYKSESQIKVFHFEYSLQWLRLTFNNEELLEKIELHAEL